MASAIIHIAVAKKINEKLKMNKDKLYIGTIAPDLSKHIGENKYKSHFLETDETDIPDLYKFLLKYKEDLSKPFTMGYFIHLYTDKLFFSKFLNNFKWKSHIKMIDGTEIQDEQIFKKHVYNDYEISNQYIIDKYELDLNIFFNKVDNLETNIDEIPMDKIQMIIDEMGLIVSNTYKAEGEMKIFSNEMLDKFIIDSAEEITNFLLVLKK